MTSRRPNRKREASHHAAAVARESLKEPDLHVLPPHLGGGRGRGEAQSGGGDGRRCTQKKAEYIKQHTRQGKGRRHKTPTRTHL